MLLNPYVSGNELAELDKRYHIHSQTNLKSLQEDGPLIITQGDGCYVEDDRGNRYLEAMSGLWCASLGFSENRLINVANKQMQTLPYYHTFNARLPDVVAKLAKKVAQVSPIPGSRIYFATSGSEANESMIKLAWALHRQRGKPSKRKILAHDKAFHGSTIFAASVAGLPNMHTAFGLPLEGIIRLRSPHYYRQANASESIEEFCDRLIKELEQKILEEGPETIAAFISEPVLGAGGVIIPPPGYFAKVQAVLRKYDILMLADEIICGFGRTGQWFGHQTMEFEPDMMSCAKGLSAGYQPISCVVVGGHLYSDLQEQSAQLDGFGHGFTNSGHPVSAAVALEAIEIYEEMGVVARVGRLATKLSAALDALNEHEIVGEIRQIGLMAAIELVSDRANRTPFHTNSKIGAQIDARARSCGLIIRNIGNSAIAMSPPYIISEDEIDLLVSRLHSSLDYVANHL